MAAQGATLTMSNGGKNSTKSICWSPVPLTAIGKIEYLKSVSFLICASAENALFHPIIKNTETSSSRASRQPDKAYSWL